MYPDSLVSCGRLSHIGCGGWYGEVEIGAPEDITGILRTLVPAYDAQAVRTLSTIGPSGRPCPGIPRGAWRSKPRSSKGDYKGRVEVSGYAGSGSRRRISGSTL